MQEKRSGIQKESANFWTDAPNTLVAILSGNIALLQAFEKERQMEEEDEEEDLGWKEEFAPCRSRKAALIYDRPGKRFEKILYSKCTHRTHSLRGYGNAGIWFRPLQTGKPGSLQGRNRSIGRGASLWR